MAESYQDPWATGTPTEPREIVVRIAECPESAVIRFCQEEIGGLESAGIRGVAALIAVLSGIHEMTLEGKEIDEWKRQH